ncbi:hypothetical protein [Bradyrhizobium sp.]|uniref:hypothetical protein n=1 Tax=Bradyrhizobium sp. TaxID=376 RepID=UPI003C38FACC
MKLGSIAVAAALVLAATSGPSAARGYAHRHHHSCGYWLHYDYTHSNQLSPMSSIYPAANWGPFFQCRLYVSPVIYVAPPGPS